VPIFCPAKSPAKGSHPRGGMKLGTIVAGGKRPVPLSPTVSEKMPNPGYIQAAFPASAIIFCPGQKRIRIDIQRNGWICDPSSSRRNRGATDGTLSSKTGKTRSNVHFFDPK